MRNAELDYRRQTMKIKIITGILVLAVIALISGATFLATASPGTQEDPFITLSYLNNSFRQQMMAEISKTEQELARALDAKIADLEAELEASKGSGVQTQGSADRFSVVSLNRGQTLTCSVGAELMLRIGSATGAGAAPALVDYSDGATLSAGTALTANHMYLVTIEGNGVKATADSVRVLVRGTYKVS
jgi:hypothetical protein